MRRGKHLAAMPVSINPALGSDKAATHDPHRASGFKLPHNESNQPKLSTFPLATASINTPGRTTIAEPTQQQSTPRQAKAIRRRREHRTERRSKTRWSLTIRGTRHRPHRACRRWLIRRAPAPPRQWLQWEPMVCSRP